MTKKTELELSTSSQLNLFEVIVPSTQKDSYSNTIDIYDAVPKYVWEKNRQSDSKVVLERQCNLPGNRSFNVLVTPAVIPQANGKTIMMYPGQREELVEDALRRLAANGQGVMLGQEVAVRFSLYELRKELQRVNRTFSLKEIKEALQILNKANLECVSSDGGATVSSPFFPFMTLVTAKDKHKDDAHCFVKFHPLVTDSVMRLSFRQFDYGTSMKIKSPLARHIFKRMSHIWVQAASNQPYTPKLMSFLSQSPQKISPTQSVNIRAMKNALDVLIEHEVVASYEAIPEKQGRKTLDVQYVIRPHARFIKEMIKANRRQKDVLNDGDKLQHGTDSCSDVVDNEIFV